MPAGISQPLSSLGSDSQRENDVTLSTIYHSPCRRAQSVVLPSSTRPIISPSTRTGLRPRLTESCVLQLIHRRRHEVPFSKATVIQENVIFDEELSEHKLHTLIRHGIIFCQINVLAGKYLDLVFIHS